MAEEEEVEVPSLKGEPARNESFGLFFFCILVICCHIWTYRDPCASRLLPWGFILGETPHLETMLSYYWTPWHSRWCTPVIKASGDGGKKIRS